jgi:hypothetical protein
MRHPFGHFVERAIAAGGQDQVGPVRDFFARYRARRARPGGGAARHPVAAVGENPRGARDELAPLPPELAGARVENDDGLTVAGYGDRSRFLVRL